MQEKVAITSVWIRHPSQAFRKIFIFRPDGKIDETISILNEISEMCESAEFHMKSRIHFDAALFQNYERYLNAYDDNDV